LSPGVPGQYGQHGEILSQKIHINFKKEKVINDLLKSIKVKCQNLDASSLDCEHLRVGGRL
jgi:hypothetical protein